jgi:hypothetical protein
VPYLLDYAARVRESNAWPETACNPSLFIMPTFETDVPSAAKPSDKPDKGVATEFRPRRREQWAAADTDETFDPKPIPPEAKKVIDQRVNEIMRQCRGPDETFFALREWFSTARKIILSVPILVRDMIRRPKDEDDEEEDEDAAPDSESGPRQPDKPQAQGDGQKPHSQQQHRGRRGGRRHNRHGGGGGRGRQNPGQGRNNPNGGE